MSEVNRAGIWKNNLSGDMAYKSFIPSPLPLNLPLMFDTETLELLIAANKSLNLLDGISLRIPSINLFMSMYVRKEALMSSQIEGTQATLEDILDPMIDKNINQNVADVVNYIKAAEFAIKRLNTLPLCNRLIREIHAVLMEGVRGREKSPGEFRRSQNWIGGQGSTLKTARYIPPAPEDMLDAMANLEIYMNRREYAFDNDILVRAALIHYQFETIHPFLDGNGRIGRLLVILFLMENRAISVPALYISYFLKINRAEYYDRMTLVRTDGNYEQWVKFFLLAVKESANDAIDTIDRLTALHEKNIVLISGIGRSVKTALKLFGYIEKNPIIEIRITAADLGISFNTAANAVARLENLKILKQTENIKRGRIFSYDAYLNILRSGT